MASDDQENRFLLPLAADFINLIAIIEKLVQNLSQTMTTTAPAPAPAPTPAAANQVLAEIGNGLLQAIDFLANVENAGVAAIGNALLGTNLQPAPSGLITTTAAPAAPAAPVPSAAVA